MSDESLSISIMDIIDNLIPSSLTCFSCIWLFFNFFKQTTKSVDFTMISILAFSHFIYSLTSLIILFYPNAKMARVYYNAYFISQHFSIFWASAMSFLVYRSVKGKDFNSIKLIVKTAIFVFVTQCLLAFL